MSKQRFKEALALVRAGRLDDALAIVRGLDLGFVLKRMTHYKGQPDHREAALRLGEAFAASRQASSEPAPAASTFEAPLPPAFVQFAPDEAVGFDRPEPFLTWVSADWDSIPPLDFGRLYYLDPWALVALGSLHLEGRTRRPPLQREGSGGAVRFARALGLDALASGREPAADLPGQMVRLNRVHKSSEIEPMAERMASLVISDPRSEDMRLAIRYVLVELFRNVVQHSRDPLGAVAAAQLMGPAQHRSRPMIQLAVADAGIGIPRSLHRAHPSLTDYRQALERALLPHISGTFVEGLTGSFENAGLGLYMISEMARQTGGRLLIATTGAALVLQSGGAEPANPKFLQPPGTGFPGTLVAFEIPTDAVQDYRTLINSILHKARERTPKRAADHWLSFTPAPEPSAERVALWAVRENTPEASELSRAKIRPALLDGRPVELDFARLDLCTQSWLHALLFEPIRLAWAMRVPIHVVNADPAVREGLRFLEAYALGG
ncbi:MAG TPA: hypothetical protein VFS43_41490 [Polyangiaceae bacterium]|nr:hypothetical protein [Polyangiaceae bacterium]